MKETKIIDGHEYAIETMNPKGTRKFYCFNDKNSKGERIEVEFVKAENDYKGHLLNVWYKKGFIKEQLKSYWQVTVYIYDKKEIVMESIIHKFYRMGQKSILIGFLRQQKKIRNVYYVRL